MAFFRETLQLPLIDACYSRVLVPVVLHVLDLVALLALHRKSEKNLLGSYES
jgi:hypothetical protein